MCLSTSHILFPPDDQQGAIILSIVSQFLHEAVESLLHTLSAPRREGSPRAAAGKFRSPSLNSTIIRIERRANAYPSYRSSLYPSHDIPNTHGFPRASSLLETCSASPSFSAKLSSSFTHPTPYIGGVATPPIPNTCRSDFSYCMV